MRFLSFQGRKIIVQRKENKGAYIRLVWILLWHTLIILVSFHDCRVRKKQDRQKDILRFWIYGHASSFRAYAFSHYMPLWTRAWSVCHHIIPHSKLERIAKKQRFAFSVLTKKRGKHGVFFIYQSKLISNRRRKWWW